MKTKKCSACGEEKLFEEFPKHRGMKDGVYSSCKVCHNAKFSEWYEKNKDYTGARVKKWKAENPEKLAAQKEQWAQKNPTYARDKKRKRRLDPEERKRINAWERARRKRNANNPEFVARNRAATMRYYRKNPEKYRARQKCQRAATPSWVDMDAVEAIYARAAKLRAEGGLRYQVHHIVPLLSSKVCGLHCEDNLTIVTQNMNNLFGNRIWPSM